jgi:large subunit ribosomal protein L10
MNRQQKEALVDSLREHFSASQAAYLVGVRGLSVNAMRVLRGKLREHGASLKVAKMRLIKRAATQDDALGGLVSHLQDQRGVVFVDKEPTVVAKVLHDFAKDNEQLSIVLGYVDRAFLDEAAVKILATLPPREVLLAQVIGTMQAPLNQFAGILRMLIVRLLVVLKKIEEKKA